ncbi:hypothetical protein Tco_0823949 [Tanacetum coccineum]|uniref:Uncharacterized protein n=1 Tax=Tanacetum coccineum TaxID=301880 RepID=A0ABQ5AJC3_9ASTR
MSSPAYTDTETISLTDGVRSSLVPTPIHDDPYMLVRHAYTSTITYTKFEPFEDPIETEEPQSLPITSAPIPSPNYTPATPHLDEELEPMEASETRTTSPSDTTSPLSPNHLLTQTSPTPISSRAFFYHNIACMAVRIQPTLSLGISTRVTEAMTLSPSSFCKRYRSSYKTPSSSASPASSPTLPLRKRYQGTFKPILDTETEGDESKAEGTGSESEESEDEGPGSESEEAASEDQQQQAILVKDTTADEPLGLGYGAARCHAIELAKGTTHNIYEVG